MNSYFSYSCTNDSTKFVNLVGEFMCMMGPVVIYVQDTHCSSSHGSFVRSFTRPAIKSHQIPAAISEAVLHVHLCGTCVPGMSHGPFNVRGTCKILSLSPGECQARNPTGQDGWLPWDLHGVQNAFCSPCCTSHTLSPTTFWLIYVI